ncbi:hypothetical protein DEU35_3169 [Microbacterium sp. AG157]|uniref:Uncharacterized protein n=2 Tax=Microbacteriaceae TaxID=85023 RepID=A0A4Y3QPY1_MICTE|nr:hypothetical protein C1632_16200 [Microbacterium testaceum]REC97399.1 hypothetical protein DEU35_3169 [Microbacterium sp. AG157]GEB46170.1 hypothetical protein MTE01_21150 [Microbacterium testaceum]
MLLRMGDISISVDEVRRVAAKMVDVVPGEPDVWGFSVADQPDLNLALAEFVGCMNDCTAERRRGVQALAAGLREVADMFESLDASAQADVRALGAVEGWVIE